MIAFYNSATPEEIAKAATRNTPPQPGASPTPAPSPERESDVRVITRAVYRANGAGYLDFKHPQHIWVVNAPKTGDEKVRIVNGERVVSNIHKPSLTPYLPAADKATGCAVIVAPGGGHRELWSDHEGHNVARWLSEHRIAAFVLKYRLARETNSTYTVDEHAVVARERGQHERCDDKADGKRAGDVPGQVDRQHHGREHADVAPAHAERTGREPAVGEHRRFVTAIGTDAVRLGGALTARRMQRSCTRMGA